MAKVDLARKWISDNKKGAKKRKSPKCQEVQYHTVAIPNPQDDSDASASERHSKTYRIKRVRRVMEGSAAYCAKVAWLKNAVSFDGDECLLFPGSHPGFPQAVRFNYRQIAASRAMCILAHGLPKEPRMQAIHSCGNGHLSCVNPKHIRWGTQADNSRDARLHLGKHTAADRIRSVVD